MYQSFDTLFDRLFVFDPAQNPQPLLAAPLLRTFSLITVKGSILLVAVATSQATIVGQIGDGAIVVDDGVLRAATWPQQGEYANVTYFLVQDDAMERLVITEAGPAQRIALFSDGLQNLALEYETKTPYEPFFAPFFSYLETTAKPDADIEQELSAYLDSASVNARTDDDKSLILAVRR